MRQPSSQKPAKSPRSSSRVRKKPRQPAWQRALHEKMDIEHQLGALVGARSGLGFTFRLPTLQEMRVAIIENPELRPKIMNLLKRWVTVHGRSTVPKREVRKQTLLAIREHLGLPLVEKTAERKAVSIGVRRRLKKIEQYNVDFGLDSWEAFVRVLQEDVGNLAGKAKNSSGLDRKRLIEIHRAVRRRLLQQTTGVTKT